MYIYIYIQRIHKKYQDKKKLKKKLFFLFCNANYVLTFLIKNIIELRNEIQLGMREEEKQHKNKL